MKNQKNIKLVDWNTEKVQLFFNHHGALKNIENNYFGKQRGKSFLRFIQNKIILAEPILDLGCGTGFFLDHLVKNKLHCFGADLSEEAIKIAGNRLKNNSYFHRASLMREDNFLPYSDNFFGTIFFLETIEHLLPQNSKNIFKEIRRVLKQEGLLIISAPDNEDLQKGIVECPYCNVSFHQMQHMKSFSQEILKDFLQENLFKIVYCGTAPFIPNFKVWLKSKISKKQWTIICPECKKIFKPQINNSDNLIKKAFKELSHLYCIAKK